MNQTCKVCGEAAAGFHFGAFTCEGCKSFFGRTYNNLSSISECKNSGQCVINRKNRTSCKACRLRKCLMVGMSKSGSRYGRRSNWFKIHCLLQEQANNNTPPPSLSPSALLQANVLYQNALQSFLPSPTNSKMARMDEAGLIKLKQGSVEDVRSTPDSAASSMIDDAFSKSPSPPSSEKETSLSTPSPSPLFHNTIIPQIFSPFLKPVTANSADLRLLGGRMTGHADLLSSLAGVAEDHQQDEPIDLSVKGSTVFSVVKKEPSEATSLKQVTAGAPLDLSK